nr:MAG TPA: hypothetical protein [Caudoviricetes sp.]
MSVFRVQNRNSGGNTYQPQVHRKDKGYLHYWSANIDDDVLASASAMYNISKRQILASQYSNFMKAQSNKINAASASGMSAQTLGKLYDAGLYRDELKKYVDMEQNQSQPPGDLEMLPLEQAIAAAKSIDLGAANNSIAQYTNALENFLNTVLKPTDSNLADLQASIVREYAAKSGISKGGLTSNQESKVCEKLLRDILSNENGEFFKVRKGSAEAQAGITTSYRKIAAAAYALKHFQGEGLPIKRALVQYGDSSKRRAQTRHTVSGESDILNEISNKINASMDNIKFGAAETTRVYGSLLGAEKVMKEMNKNLKIENKHLGNIHNGISIDIITQNNKIFEQALKEINVSKSRLSVKTSKADNGFYVTENGVRAGVTFTVKDGEGLIKSTNGVQSASIRLQSGTPLLTLLAREAGFSSDELFTVYQMLVAHGNEPLHDNWWERIKDTLNDLAFLDALAGISQEDRATFMVLGDRIATVQDILVERMSNNGANISSKVSLSKWNKGSLSRAPYVAMNVWQGSKPNTTIANERSAKLFNSVSDKLYATKIQIDMTIRNTQTLMSLFK